MKSTFSLSFFLKRTVRNKNGEMPIIGRITVNGNAVEFRPHLSIKSELWSVAKGKAIGRSAEIVQLNTMLNSIRKVISAHYQTLSAEDGYVTAEKIREAYLGQDERTLKRVAEEKRGKTTLIDFFGKFNAEYKLKVDAKLVRELSFHFSFSLSSCFRHFFYASFRRVGRFRFSGVKR
nr:Arm DNA-binding domain-containing protein [Odoribacter splanchnicus]